MISQPFFSLIFWAVRGGRGLKGENENENLQLHRSHGISQAQDSI